jgi:hypothetical protein
VSRTHRARQDDRLCNSAATTTACTALCLLLVACVGSVSGSAITDDAQIADRLRTYSPSVAAAIRAGLTHSVTFRRVVEKLLASDGIVYVSEGGCRYVHACLLMKVNQLGSYRMLSIHVASNRAMTDVVASIGHELQHALEILGSGSGARTPSFAIEAVFEGVGWRDAQTGAFETQAAIVIGETIREEMRRVR